jgi:hypothetical protein
MEYYFVKKAEKLGNSIRQAIRLYAKMSFVRAETAFRYFQRKR